MSLLFVVYDAINGDAVPDGKAEAKANECIEQAKNWAVNSPENLPYKVIVGNSLVVDYFRLAVVKELLKPDDLKFGMDDNNGDMIVLDINKDGRLNRWPNGFCDYTETVLAQFFRRVKKEE